MIDGVGTVSGMTDRSDERPLTSDEMIKQAREDLADRPEVSELNIDRDAIAEQVEKAMPSPRELTQPDRPRRRPERRVRRESRPPAGFGDADARAQRGVAIAVALALLIAGLAAFLAVAAGSGG